MNFARVLLLLFLTSCYGAKKKSKSVTTLIDAKWELNPLVLEMAEYISDENESLFWKFYDAVSALEPSLAESKTDKDYYDRALSVAEEVLSPFQISIMKFSLSLHIYSPKVEMFNEIAAERGLFDCFVGVDINNIVICDLVELKKFMANTNDELISANSIHLDHKFGKNTKAPTVVLYGELGSSKFSTFYVFLKRKAESNEIQLVVRHWIKNKASKKLRLSGYGVELQMKSTEYKVQDDTKVQSDTSEEATDEEEEVEGFNFNRLKQLYPDKVSNLDKFKQELLESTSELAPLKMWEFQDLSLQAAQRIMSAPSEEALKTMIHIASNFPTQARSLVKLVINPDMKNEIKLNSEKFTSSLHLQPSDTALFMNGMFFDFEVHDIYTILEYIRQEIRIMEGLRNIGFSEKNVFKSLIGLDLTNSGGDYALDIRDSAVFWLNDIENDKQYKRWSSSLMDLLRPTFPGMLRSVKKNLYNLVIIGNPANLSVRPLLKLIQSFLVHNAPLRLGIVFAVDGTKNGLEDSGVALLNAYNYILEVKDPSHAINFITDVYAAKEDNEITPEDVSRLLKLSFSGCKLSEIFGPDSDYNTGLQLSADFIAKSGLRTMPQALLNGVPLQETSLNADDFEEAVLSEIMNQTPVLQKAIYKGELTDSLDVVDYLMSRPNIMPRLNERILSTKSKFIDLTNEPKLNEIIQNSLLYMTNEKHQKNDISLITNWIITDLSNEFGRDLLENAINQMENSGKVRVAVLLNSDENDDKMNNLNKAILAILKQFPNESTKNMKKILDNWDMLSQDDKLLMEFNVNEKYLNEINEIVVDQRNIIKNVINFNDGQRGIVSTGRLIGPLDENERFTLEDFNLLERFSLSTIIEKIYNAIISKTDGTYINSDMLMKTVSLLASRHETKNRFEVVPYEEKYSVIKIPAKYPDQPSFDLVAIMDPVSNGAHKLATVLNVLQHVINGDIRIFLNCADKNSDMPIKSFYRYVLEPSIQFTSDGKQSSGPIARFSSMPGTPLLTLNMLVPDNWFVESIASPHDLDNIRLDDVDSNVHSQFELEYLILDGHCFDSNMGSPPRGLQLILGTDNSPAIFDTIVMANLGYFQLKANPGQWKLNIRPGRSTDLYDITGFSHDSVDHTINKSEIKIYISSFRAHTIKLKVTKKPDKLNIDLLAEPSEEKQGIWGSLASTFGGTEEPGEKIDETINIFSLASGHLYERFLRIMMLSVLKKTESPVKFWFLKNYLSPTFKDFLPRMAKKYNFQYELVQYKWPRWLHQQSEKQRIIWGYKILFLDVLFPLDVKKIIFVDADQVVRTDLKELVDLDLGGAPYGYTPFCDSRKEMDGFRFWKSGYWRSHLQGRTYHISALYVVDLKRFRRIAAGDRLRGQYQALSQDPNSLSNLDQDLPNNMIHQVAIKSLPQEWLWCETWCDDESKAKAKTIDLCNNPLTKEAKLTAAMRILPEWKDYDNEIKELQLQLGDTEHHEEEQEILSDRSSNRHEKHTEL